jgi:hypothetical protein
LKEKLQILKEEMEIGLHGFIGLKSFFFLYQKFMWKNSSRLTFIFSFFFFASRAHLRLVLLLLLLLN